MIKHQYVEDYIAIIAGFRHPINLNYSFDPHPPIKLSEFESTFILSLAEQISVNAVSDRQATLAEQIIKKYANQLAALGVAQPDPFTYRHPPRLINRARTLDIVDNELYLRFPFEPGMVETVKEFSKISQGSTLWDSDQKCWKCGLTEFNLNWCVSYAKIHNLSMSEEVESLFADLIECENTPVRIALAIDDQTCLIENAATSLIEYVEEHIGFTDIVKLVDYAPVLGYTVKDDILAVMTDQFGNTFTQLCSFQAQNVSPKTVSFDDIFKWATLVDRVPIVIYNPNFTKIDLSSATQYFTEDEIIRLTPIDKKNVIKQSHKLIVINNDVSILPVFLDQIPLLISFANLMYGNKKKLCLQAEKIIYYCPELPKGI